MKPSDQLSAHDLAVAQAVAAERERCAKAVLTVLREIGAVPGSSIDSALALVHLTILNEKSE